MHRHARLNLALVVLSLKATPGCVTVEGLAPFPCADGACPQGLLCVEGACVVSNAGGMGGMFSVPQNSQLVATVHTLGNFAACSGDWQMWLFGTNGTRQLAYNNDISGGNLCSKIAYTFPTAGTYYLGAKTVSGAQFPYQLTLSATSNSC